MRWVALFMGVGGVLWGQLPARYVLKADALSWVWRSYRVGGEYRLFRWAPPFEANVERPKYEGLTLQVWADYVRLLPVRGVVLRPGGRYYFLFPRKAPHGLWAGLHGVGGLTGAPQEKTTLALGIGLSVGYQHIFRQSYGGVVEPYLLVEVRGRSLAWLSPVQVGLSLGIASRRWRLRLTR